MDGVMRSMNGEIGKREHWERINLRQTDGAMRRMSGVMGRIDGAIRRTDGVRESMEH